MLVYILKSTFCLVLLLGVYHLFLEKEKMHLFNRFYLLGSILFSFIVPSFTITVAPTILETPIVTEAVSLNQFSSSVMPQQQTVETINYTTYLIGLYILISSILLILLSKKVYQLLNKVKRNQQLNYFSATVVLLKERIVPYTFLNYIFINKFTYQTKSVEEQILTHELAHVEQKHSIDVLFIEVLQNLFWFNPIFRYYKKAMQLNHEFLADDAVINSHKNISEYQQVLLNTTAQNNNIYLASNLNYSLTKKRLLMMTTPSSKTKILLKKLLVAPLVAGFIFAFAQRVEAQEKLPQVVEVKLDEKSISKKEMNEYKKLFETGKKQNMYKQKNVQRMIALYKSMSKKQQNSITDIRKVIPPPPPMDIVYTYKRLAKRVQRTPKNRKANIIYLNELYKKMDATQKKKVVKPSKTPVKIEVIEVKENQKSKKKELKKNPKPVSIKVIEKKKNTITIFINKNAGLLINNKVSSISKLNTELDKIKIDKNKAHIIIKTDEKTKKEDLLKVKKILRENRFYKITINSKLLPPPPPMDIVYTYKRLANRIKKTPENRKANVIYLKELYGKMTDSQKKKVVKPSKIPVRIEVIEKKKKNKKSSKPQIREIKPVSIKVVEKVNNNELVEIIEEEEKVVEQHELREIEETVEEEEIEVKEILEAKEVVEITELKEVEDLPAAVKGTDLITKFGKTQNSKLKKIYYINNKKVSERRIKKLNPNKIKKLEIKKTNNKIGHIYITLKK